MLELLAEIIRRFVIVDAARQRAIWRTDASSAKRDLAFAERVAARDKVNIFILFYLFYFFIFFFK
jgi:hypothetical protein